MGLPVQWLGFIGKKGRHHDEALPSGSPSLPHQGQHWFLLRETRASHELVFSTSLYLFRDKVETGKFGAVDEAQGVGAPRTPGPT